MTKFLTSKRKERLEKLNRSTKDRRVFQETCAVLAIDAGRTEADVASVLRISPDTISRWIQKYINSGYDDDSFGPGSGGVRKTILDEDQEKVLATWIADKNPSGMKQIQAHIKAAFRVEFSDSGLCDWLARHHFVYGSSAVVPAKLPSLRKQHQMVSQLAEVIAKATQEPDLRFLCYDESYPTAGTRPGKCWYRAGEKPMLVDFGHPSVLSTQHASTSSRLGFC